MGEIFSVSLNRCARPKSHSWNIEFANVKITCQLKNGKRCSKHDSPKILPSYARIHPSECLMAWDHSRRLLLNASTWNFFVLINLKMPGIKRNNKAICTYIIAYWMDHEIQPNYKKILYLIWLHSMYIQVQIGFQFISFLNHEPW